jgi:hypothetical protein
MLMDNLVLSDLVHPPIPLCMFCEKKSADCAHGNLRASQSCVDSLYPFENTKTEKNQHSYLHYE